MKIRKGYVSNSSSSSFIVAQDLTDKGIACLKLSQAQKELINGSVIYDEKIWLDVNKDFYLTEFICDDEKKYDIIDGVEHVFYQEGQLCGEPRNPDYCNEYNLGYNSVYLLKKHDVAKQMTFNQFVNKYRKSDLPKEVIVKFEDDGVKLTYVY